MIHWHAPTPPETIHIDLRLQEPPAVQPFHTALPPVRVVSIPIISAAVPVRSFRFASAATSASVPTAAQDPPAPVERSSRLPPSATAPCGHTRIKPPRDIVKLSDRLEYVLQPSLETLLADGSLAFPSRPFPFQLEGVAFLYPRQAAILADEMGLGKTMQAITAIRLLLHRKAVRTVLLVCPKPLVANWRREFAAWAPEIPTMAIEGQQARRRWLWGLPDVPVRIANYEVLLRDFGGRQERPPKAPENGKSRCSGSLDSAPDESPESPPTPHFDLVVLDESQRIKNRASSTHQIACFIPRARSWALTGTPVENSTDDLVGIFEFLAPGFLKPEMKPRAIGRSIGDYVLRRTKDQVLKDLPPKLVHDESLELLPEQRESYRLAEEEGKLRLSAMASAVTIRHVFELVLRLKQICNFDPASGESSKLERLEADVEEIAASGRKAIVFSQWVGTLVRLAVPLRRFGPLEYHGRVPSGRREAVLQRFREDPSRHVLLMSYGAGGVGLNLQFVNYVFLFDRWWNPAVEDQAINRAHRIGVDGPVSVMRFLMLDTIEERIDRILQEKRELFEAIFDGAERKGNLGLTQEEIFGLFDLKSPSGPFIAAA